MNNTKKYSVHIKGATPLIMNCDKACNPLHPLTKKIKEITCIRKKTDDHHIALARLKFEAALYYDKKLGVYMPSKCLQGCIKASAKKFRLGKQTKAVILDEPLGYPLIPYKGQNVESLYSEVNEEGERTYVFVENLVVGMARVVQTRPIFHRWEVKFNLLLDTELLPEADLEMILETAGYEYGLCDLRPGMATGNYGTFSVEEFKKAK
jgi:hypothetical protein